MLVSLIRSFVLYLVLLVTIRLMGKRQIGEMEPSEFVVTMLIANLASIPMQDNGIALLSGVVPILTVLALELMLAVLSLKSIRLRRILCGKPVILMENGKLIQRNLRRTRINPDELTAQLRTQGILDLAAVKYAILETNGQISVFPFSKETPAAAKDAGIKVQDIFLPYTIISDGRLLRENLLLANRSDVWLRDVLHAHGCRTQDVFLFSVDEKGTTYFVRKEHGTA